MTTKQMIKENANLKAFNEATKEAAKNLYTFEAVFGIVCDYWESTEKRVGFDKAAAIFGFNRPTEVRAYLESGTLHPSLYEVGDDGKTYFVIHGERPVEDTSKTIKDRRGKTVHPYKLEKGAVVMENCTNPIKRWTAEKMFELLLQDQYFKAKDVVATELASATAIAEAQGVSLENLIDKVSKDCVKKQQKINEQNVETAKAERKAAKKNAKAAK